MPAIPIEQARDKLTKAVKKLSADDVVAAHDELFPAGPATTKGAANGSVVLAKQIIDHIRQGLEPEEVVDLWNVVFPKDRNVYYDEETKQVHFNEEEPETSDYAE
ncbi:MAG: hypothetical protein HYS13_12010 [Planctomycetia bacterium]|nr:hypothetical protein [Planctomycetia bacterium]